MSFVKFLKNKIRLAIYKKFVANWFLSPYLKTDQRNGIMIQGDPVRYGTVYLALEQIKESNIGGSLAECGVYKGEMSKFIHNSLPQKKLYLFDTFEGFPDKDSLQDNRFKDTSVEIVLNNIGSSDNIYVKKGYFPQTLEGMDEEIFAFVMIDFDKYEPTMAALEYFYNKVVSGGYIFVHDYNSPESNWACSKALNNFLSDKPEKIMCIPDMYGTAFFRKV